ncbi:MAG: COX15/CtaA family protein [Jiangellales bacterium]
MSRPATASRSVRGLALASLVSQIGIVVTGGAVRLTGSGLGCPTFPRCTDDSYVNTPEYGIHGYIEFGNRLLTFVLAVIALATLVAVWRARPRRRDLVEPAVVLFLGIPIQALLGGITVLTELNPWVVMLHFIASAALIGVATVLVQRTREPAGPVRPIGGGVAGFWLRRLAWVVVAVTYVTIYLGTIVTGSGPHAGDDMAQRTGLDLESVSQLHVDAVFLLLGLTVGTWFAARAAGSPGRVAYAAAVLLGVELAQGAIGFAQYFTGLPIVLVGLHMLGATLLVVAAVSLLLSTRERVPAEGMPLGSAEDQDVRPDGDEDEREVRDRGVEEAHRAQVPLA